MVSGIPLKREKFCLVLILCLLIFKWFQEWLSNTSSFIYTQLSGFEYFYATLHIRFHIVK